MVVALRDLTENNLYPLAAVVSLNPDQLHPASGTDKVVPSQAWLAEQYRRIPGLPQPLLVPPIIPMGAGIKAAQVVKRVVMAASGGADAVAAKAAANGIPLRNMLHPHATPTILCFAHKKLHPVLMREMFYHLTKEVADYADPVRRHPQHAHLDSDTTSPCQEREVRDWSYRMMGLSALWCTRHTFRCLDKGRQAPAPGYKAPKSKSRHQRQPSSSKAAAKGASSSSSSSSSSPRHRIRSNLRMPHMAFPCEVCILATVGSRCQALIDLRAGMLSRLLAEEAERVMRAKRHEERDKKKSDKKHSSRHKNSKGKSTSSHHRNASTSAPATAASEHASAEDFGAGFGSFKPKSYPHLWPLLDAYINAFGDEVASEIRRLSEALAKPLFMVRICESSRRRNERREDRRKRSHKEPASQSESPPFVRVKQPPRMVTKNGHRLPLPLLPPKLDPWATKHSGESEVAPDAVDQGPAEDGPDAYEGYADGYIDADGAFYAASQDLEGPASVVGGASQIMAGANEDGEAEYYYVAPEDEEDEDCEDHSAFLDSRRCDLAAAMQGSVPPWEDDYQRHIIDTQSEVPYFAQAQGAMNKHEGVTIVDDDRSFHSQHGSIIVDGDSSYQEQQSFVSVTVHSADPFEYDYGLCGRYAPARRDRDYLSTVQDTPVSEASSSRASSVSRGRRSKVPSPYVSDTPSSQASRSTLRPHPSSPDVRASNPPPLSTTSTASGISKYSHSRAPSSSAPSTSSKRTAPTVISPTALGRTVSSVSSLSSTRTPSHHEYRPVSSVYSAQVEQQSAPRRSHQNSTSYASSSRHTKPSKLAPTSPSASRSTTTSTSSHRASSSATSVSSASTAKVPASSSRAHSSTPAASSVSSRLTRPTAASHSRNATVKGTSHKQSAPSTAFVPPTNRRPSAPESYVAMQNKMTSLYASASSSSRHASIKTSGATASSIPSSEVSSSSTLSSLYSGYAGDGIPSELFDAKNDTCSLTPDDSISVVFTRKYMEEEQARWEAKMQREQREAERVLANQFSSTKALHSAEEVRWLQEQRRHPSSQRAAPISPPSAAPSPLFSRGAPATNRMTASTHRNLNQYRPDASRRPVEAPSGRSQPKPPRARHRRTTNLTDTKKVTEWPPVEWS